jgi:hypothetical protein
MMVLGARGAMLHGPVRSGTGSPLSESRYILYVMNRAPPADPPWRLYEVVKRDRRPVSEAFRNANSAELAHIARELRLLRVAGMPPDRERGNPDIQQCFKWKSPRRDQALVYVLKAKPSQWRLYFYVIRQSRIIEFIYAVAKKENRRDPQDEAACKRVLAGRFDGSYGSAPFDVPGGC